VIDAMVTPDGYQFEIPLTSLDTIFDISDYWGKNKTLYLEFDVCKDKTQWLELMRPYENTPAVTNPVTPVTRYDLTFIDQIQMRMSDIKLCANEVRLNDGFVLDRFKFAKAHPEDMYSQFRGDLWETRVFNVTGKVQNYTVNFSNFKLQSLTPPCLIMFMYSEDQFKHINSQCLAPRNIIQQVLNKISFKNTRRNMSDSAGQDFYFDLTEKETKAILYQHYLSFINGGAPTSYDQRNNVNLFNENKIKEFSSTANNFWNLSYNEPIALDLTPELNFITNMDSARVMGSNSSEMILDFNQEIQNAVLVVAVLHKYEYASQGIGNQEKISLIPANLRVG
jgi:hypothetical protein